MLKKYSSDSVPCLVNSKMSSSWLVWPLKEPKNHAGREVCFLESSTHLGCVYIALYYTGLFGCLLRKVAIYNGSISPKSQCQILHILILYSLLPYTSEKIFLQIQCDWYFFLPCTMRQHPDEYFNTKRTIALCLFWRLILHSEQKPVNA